MASADLPPVLPADLPVDWPHRGASRRIEAAGLAWHVQRFGRAGAPAVVLLHGTGASAHSWADVVGPLLDETGGRIDLIVPDLPGHGFTRGAALDALRLPRVAADLRTLVQATLGARPVLLVGHSAGAAVALQWHLDVAAGAAAATSASAPPRAGAPAVLGFNPSLVAPPEFYLRFMAPLVNPVATAGPVASLLASIAGATGMVDRLLDSTASAVPPAQRARYRTLFADPAHVRGAIGFMAAADLAELLRRSAAAAAGAIAFVTGSRDAWVPERNLAPVIARWLPQAASESWRGGHLLHEEDAAKAAARIVQALAAAPDTRAPAPAPSTPRAPRAPR